MKPTGGTPCAKAIQLFEEKTGTPAAEAEQVRLICQLPPIEKMDNSLNSLVACKHLSLSTNCIEKIINLPNLRSTYSGLIMNRFSDLIKAARTTLPKKNLQVLSLARNQIKRISGLEEVGQTLKELWLSYNQIEKLDGLQPCVRLEVLYMSNNKIKSWEEVEKLAALPHITNVLFKGNPFYETADDVRSQMLRRLPKLTTLDGETVTEDMREKAQMLV